MLVERWVKSARCNYVGFRAAHLRLTINLAEQHTIGKTPSEFLLFLSIYRHTIFYRHDTNMGGKMRYVIAPSISQLIVTNYIVLSAGLSDILECTVSELLEKYRR